MNYAFEYENYDFDKGILAGTNDCLTELLKV